MNTRTTLTTLFLLPTLASCSEPDRASRTGSTTATELLSEHSLVDEAVLNVANNYFQERGWTVRSERVVDGRACGLIERTEGKRHFLATAEGQMRIVEPGDYPDIDACVEKANSGAP